MSKLNFLILKEQLAKEHPTDSEHWHPSQVGGCVRRAVLSREGMLGIPPDEQLLRKFWMGDLLHKTVQSLLERCEGFKVLGHELEVSSATAGLLGALDTLVEYDDGTIEVIEIKTVNSLAFRHKSMPYAAHLTQLACYMVFAKPAPSRGRLIYISKDDAYIQEFTIDLSDALIDTTTKKLADLDLAWTVYKQDAELPAVLPLVPVIRRGKPAVDKEKNPIYALDPECKRCQYVDYCFGATPEDEEDDVVEVE